MVKTIGWGDEEEMTFEDAEQVQIPFGQYRGSTLGEILEDDPTYLRWLTDEADLKEGRFTRALMVFTEADWVADEIEAAVAEQERDDGR